MLLVHFALGAVAFWTIRRTKNIVQRAVKAIALQKPRSRGRSAHSTEWRRIRTGQSAIESSS